MLIPYIGNGPLISWMYPVFGVRGASTFLGVSEWVLKQDLERAAASFDTEKTHVAPALDLAS